MSRAHPPDRQRETNLPAGSREVLQEQEQQLLQVGCELLNRLFVVVKTCLLFDATNAALNRPLAHLFSGLEALGQIGEPHAAIGVNHDDLFFNRHLLRPDSGTFRNGQHLGRIFAKLKVQELQFDAQCTKSALREFAVKLRQVLVSGGVLEELEGIAGITVVPRTEDLAASESIEVDRRIQMLRVFAAAIAMMDRVLAQAARQERWSPSLVRRVAHDLVDACTQEPDLMLCLLHLPVTASEAGAHVVRTAVLAIRCAVQAELPRHARMLVALIALYHHLAPSPSTPRVGGGPAPEETDPLESALALCGGGGLNEALIESVVGVYEAAAAAAGQTALYRDAKKASHLLGRIVFLADRYAVLMSTLRPDEALRVLLFEHQAREPTLTQLLVNAVGLYPVGTVVQLESGERAIVVEAPRRRQQLLRPVVQIVDGIGTGLVDLSQDSRYGRILSTASPAEAHLNVSHYFLL